MVITLLLVLKWREEKKIKREGSCMIILLVERETKNWMNTLLVEKGKKNWVNFFSSEGKE